MVCNDKCPGFDKNRLGVWCTYQGFGIRPFEIGKPCKISENRKREIDNSELARKKMKMKFDEEKERQRIVEEEIMIERRIIEKGW